MDNIIIIPLRTNSLTVCGIQNIFSGQHWKAKIYNIWREANLSLDVIRWLFYQKNISENVTIHLCNHVSHKQTEQKLKKYLKKYFKNKVFVKK